MGRCDNIEGKGFRNLQEIRINPIVQLLIKACAPR